MSHVLLNPSRFGSSLTWQQRVLAMPGLLGYWRLGETSGTTFADSSGGGHSFTQPAGVTLGASGVNTDGNKAILYGGTPASIANASWMNPGGDGTLWAMGCFKTGTTGTERHFWSRWTNNTNYMFSLGVTSTNRVAARIRTGVGFAAAGTTTVTDNAWHMVFMTYDGSNLRAYLDDLGAEGSTSASGTISTGQGLGIGRGFLGSSWTTGDGIDEIAFGGGAGVPSAADIAALWASR